MIGGGGGGCGGDDVIIGFGGLFCKSVSLNRSINQVSLACEEGSIKGSIELEGRTS
jgi:hypothetical protein